MKIVIAPDSFKDSLSAQGVAEAIARGLAQVWPQATLIKCPMADGGDHGVEEPRVGCFTRGGQETGDSTHNDSCNGALNRRRRETGSTLNSLSDGPAGCL